MALPCLRVFGKSWFSEEQRKDRAKGGREDKEGHGLPHSRTHASAKYRDNLSHIRARVVDDVKAIPRKHSRRKVRAR